MPATVIAFKILLILLPGYLTLIIKNSLSERRAKTDAEFVMTILLFDVVIFLAYLPVVALFPKLKPFMFAMSDSKIDVVGLSLKNGLLIVVISVVLGVLAAVFSNRDLLHTLCRKLSLTYKSGRYSIWNDVFSQVRGQWIIVHLEDGTRIMGWPRHYSADPEERCLFIADAEYLGRKKKDNVIVNGPGVLVTPESKIALIEFLSPSRRRRK